MQNKKQELFEYLKKIALIKGKDITTERLSLYVEMLDGFDLEDTRHALFHLTTKSKFFPDIAEILEVLNPPVNNKIESQDIAGRILGAIKIYGYVNELEAKDYLGDQAWSVVQRNGGWSRICKTPEREIGTLMAQLRQQAEVRIYKSQENKPKRINYSGNFLDYSSID